MEFKDFSKMTAMELANLVQESWGRCNLETDELYDYIFETYFDRDECVDEWSWKVLDRSLEYNDN